MVSPAQSPHSTAEDKHSCLLKAAERVQNFRDATDLLDGDHPHNRCGYSKLSFTSHHRISCMCNNRAGISQTHQNIPLSPCFVLVFRACRPIKTDPMHAHINGAIRIALGRSERDEGEQTQGDAV